MKLITMIAGAMLLAAPALAQTTSTGQNTAGPTNSGPGATVTVPRSGTGAETTTTNSAAGGNAEQNQKAVPNTGSTGGGNAGSGG